MSVDSGDAQPMVAAGAEEPVALPCIPATAPAATAMTAAIVPTAVVVASAPLVHTHAVSVRAPAISPERALLLALMDMPFLPGHVRVLVAHVLQ